MIQKVRVGNDFIYLWVLKRNGETLDFSQLINKKLFRWVKGNKKEIKFEELPDGILRIEIQTEDFQEFGTYRLIFQYAYADVSLMDGDDKKEHDVVAFSIVEWSEEATRIDEMTVTSDILLGLKGDKGDSAFTVWNKENGNNKTYQDWIDFLQSPANDAIVDADAATLRANNAAALANTKASEADIATGKANTATQQANDARNGAIQATRETIIAKDATIQATQEANTATGLTSTAINESNIATGKANTVVNTINTVVIPNAETAAQNANNANSAFSDAEIIREQQEADRQTNAATAITNVENAFVDVNTAKDDYYDVVKPDIIAQ